MKGSPVRVRAPASRYLQGFLGLVGGLNEGLRGLTRGLLSEVLKKEEAVFQAFFFVRDVPQECHPQSPRVHSSTDYLADRVAQGARSDEPARARLETIWCRRVRLEGLAAELGRRCQGVGWRGRARWRRETVAYPVGAPRPPIPMILWQFGQATTITRKPPRVEDATSVVSASSMGAPQCGQRGVSGTPRV